MLDPTSTSAFLADWQACLDQTDLDTRRWVSALAERHADEVARAFYAALLADPRTGTMLDHGVVHERLHASLAGWVRLLFDAGRPTVDQLELQRRTGAVHARIGVSIELLERGAREVKRTLAARLGRDVVPPGRLVAGVQLVHELVDLAIAGMGSASAADRERQMRADETYRLLFLSQDLSMEHERQRARLLEWAQHILYRHFWKPRDACGAAGEPSDFALWLEHKASVLFEGAPEVAQIRQRLDTIESDLLPRLDRARGRPEAAGDVVAAIHDAIGDIKRLLAAMFDRVVGAPDDRDGVAPRLLGRRFFPTIARREIEHVQRRGGSFALLLCDLDDFEAARESLGAAAADRLLGSVADVLADHVRAGDFVFRIGDDQFVVLLVETDAAGALGVAEGLRRRIEATAPRLVGQASVPLRASFGVAAFDGHPDYQRLLDRAGDALRRAQHAGGNRCAGAA